MATTLFEVSQQWWPEGRQENIAETHLHGGVTYEHFCLPVDCHCSRASFDFCWQYSSHAGKAQEDSEYTGMISIVR